jgi:uncharacterized membrane protein
MTIGIAFHILAAVMWVGGLYFMLVILRPSMGTLEPAVRFPLWYSILSRFFPLVWIGIAVLLASGFGMAHFGFGGLASVGSYVRAMAATGLLTTAVYAFIYFAPWRTFGRAVHSADWIAAEKSIGQIRLLITTDLILGVVTVVVGASGRYFG